MSPLQLIVEITWGIRDTADAEERQEEAQDVTAKIQSLLSQGPALGCPVVPSIHTLHPEHNLAMNKKHCEQFKTADGPYTQISLNHIFKPTYLDE